MKKILFALSAFALVLTSCDKDEDDNSEVTTENLAGAYKLVSMKMKVNNGPEMDVTSSIDDCSRDDIQTLLVNGTYTITDAGVQCSPTTTDSGTWSLQNTTTILIDSDPFTIKSWDGDKLEITETYTDQGITYTVTVLMDKQ